VVELFKLFGLVQLLNQTAEDYRTAERIIGSPLPTLQELYSSRVRKKA